MESRFKRTACAANTSEQQARARRTNVAAPIGRAQGDAKSLRSEDDAACEKHQVQGRANHRDKGPGGQLACPAKELDLHRQTIERSNSEQRKGRGAAAVQPFYLYSAYLSRIVRADERTRTAVLISSYEFVYTLSSSSRSVRESACPCCYSVDRIRRLIRYVPVRINRVAVPLQ